MSKGVCVNCIHSVKVGYSYKCNAHINYVTGDPEDCRRYNDHGQCPDFSTDMREDVNHAVDSILQD